MTNDTASTPLVTVVIPAYNVSAYMPATLASVFAQDFTNFEVIVVNDGSPDTPALEAAIAPYRDRIHYVIQQNAGPSAARNTAIRQARGEYLAFLDGDDLWLPHCLREQVARALADPTLAVMYGDVEIIDDPSCVGKTARQLNHSVESPSFLSLLSERATVTTSCIMARRDWCQKVGLFDPIIRRCEDLDLWLRIAHAGGRFGGTTEVLAQYRRHGFGASADEIAMAKGVLAVLEKCERTLALTPHAKAALAKTRNRQRAVLHYNQGKRAFAVGDYATARRSLLEANTVMRSFKLSLIARGLGVAPTMLARVYSFTTDRRR